MSTQEFNYETLKAKAARSDVDADMLTALHTARILIGSYVGAGLKDPATLRAFETVKNAIARAESQS